MSYEAILKQLARLPDANTLKEVDYAALAQLNLTPESSEALQTISMEHTPIFEAVEDDATIYAYLSAQLYASAALISFQDKSLYPHFIEFIQSAADSGHDVNLEIVHEFVLPFLPDMMKDLLETYKERKKDPYFSYFFFLLLYNLPTQESFRDQVIETALESVSETDAEENSLLIKLLMKYDAVEKIAEISALMETGCYEPEEVGDMEEVKISMGLLKERETEIPGDHLFWCEPSLKAREAALTRPEESAPATAFIEYYLNLYSSAHGIKNLEFLTGLIAGRVFIQSFGPEYYYFSLEHEIWCLEDLETEIGYSHKPPTVPWLSEQHSENFYKTASALHNNIAEKIESEDFQIDGDITEWVSGFQYALDKHGLDAGFSFTEEFSALLDSPTTGTNKELAELLIKNRTLLQEYREEVRKQQEEERLSKHPQTIVNTEAKVGRNDPCPCGSGKKYKKCCA